MNGGKELRIRFNRWFYSQPQVIKIIYNVFIGLLNYKCIGINVYCQLSATAIRHLYYRIMI